MTEPIVPKGCPPIGTWLRHKQRGDLAQVTVHEGNVVIKPNIPGSPVFYNAAQYYDWNIELKPKQLPPGSFARVAYEADRVLCEIHPDLKRQLDWLSLPSASKASWIEARVKFDNLLRQTLYNSIMKTLEENSK